MRSLKQDLEKEITYRTSRSSGSGGQHVNKVESRVEACLDIGRSQVLTPAQKQLILTRLKNRIDSRGGLTVSCATSRSQHQNRKLATDRLLQLIEQALRKMKPRKRTEVPKSAKEKRLQQKKQRSELKSMRRFRPDV